MSGLIVFGGGMGNTGERDVLLNRIKELESLVEGMRPQMNREELVDLPWAGNIGTRLWSVP